MNPSIRTKLNNEKLAFEVIALQTVFKGKEIPPAIQEKLALGQLALSKLKKRRSEFNTLSCGEKATVFFIQNPDLISTMLTEADKRHQRSQAGEDMTSDLLENVRLYDFCRDQSNAIYTQDGSDNKNYLYSTKYRRIQSNFVWTMEQAALSAQMALDTIKPKPAPTEKTKSEAKPEIPYPLTEAERHADGFYDWRDDNITPEEYTFVLEDDHKDQDDYPSSPVPTSLPPAPPMPATLTQPNLPGFEKLIQEPLPRARKITTQKTQIQPTTQTRQYGS